jgi:acetyl esterase
MRLDVESRAFLDAMDAQRMPPIETLPLPQARTAFEMMQSAAVPHAAADVEQHIVDTPLGAVPVRVVRPRGSTGRLPVIVYLHGGGWILGSFDSYKRLVCDIAAASGAAVVFVEYTRAPEATFPTPLEEVYAVTRFVAEHGSEWNVDGSRIAVSGDSAGGNMAAAVALLAAERGGPRIRLQVLFCPALNADFATESYRKFADGPLVTRAAFRTFWDAYAPDPNSRSSPAAAPLLASAEQLRQLPPAVIITSENDVVRDDGEEYAARLMMAGVPVTAACYIGTVHDFMMINALADSPAAHSAIHLACAAIQRALADVTFSSASASSNA